MLPTPSRCEQCGIIAACGLYTPNPKWLCSDCGRERLGKESNSASDSHPGELEKGEGSMNKMKQGSASVEPPPWGECHRCGEIMTTTQAVLAVCENHPELGKGESIVTPISRDDLILNLCAEAGDDVETNPKEVIAAFLSNHNPALVQAAADGEVAALVELRQACGLPIFS